MNLDENAHFDDYIEKFLGFGNLKAPYWFVGMEQGLNIEGKTNEEKEKNINQWIKSFASGLNHWAEQGKPHTVDIKGGDAAKQKWFSKRPVIQPTWGKLIRCYLAANRKLSANEGLAKAEVKEYQRDHFGTESGQIAVLELLPLPNPKSSDWIYEGRTARPELHSRESYEKFIIPLRAERYLSLIQKYRPKVVLFYTKKYWSAYKRVLPQNVEPFKKNKDGWRFGHDRGTTYVLATSPVTRGLPNTYYDGIGRFLADCV